MEIERQPSNTVEILLAVESSFVMTVL